MVAGKPQLEIDYIGGYRCSHDLIGDRGMAILHGIIRYIMTMRARLSAASGSGYPELRWTLSVSAVHGFIQSEV
jgi:hypothetical protein